MNDPVRLTSERTGARMSMARSGWDTCLSDPGVPLSPDWRHAVCVATALVSENWVLPETAYHPAVTEMGEELAPLLCAYGL